MKITLSKKQWENIGKTSGLDGANNQFVIRAKRPWSKEDVFFCSSQTQGEKMIPNALSMAFRFNSLDQSKEKLEAIKPKYKGLIEWSIEEV